MRLAVYAPFFLAVVLRCVAPSARRLHPRTATCTLLVALVAVSTAAIGSLALLAWPLAARWPQLAAQGPWQSTEVARDVPVPAVVSAVAMVLLVLLAVRLARQLRFVWSERSARRRLHGALEHDAATPWSSAGVTIVRDDLPVACAVAPVGRGPVRILVSTAMLEALDETEQRAVVEHERAHLRHRHGALLVIGDLAIAANPVLAGLRPELAFEIERWADEDAAAVSGRDVTGRALGRAAIAQLERRRLASLLHIHGASVPLRVEALLRPVGRRRWPAMALVVVSVVALAAVAHSAHDTEDIFDHLLAVGR